MADYKLLDPNRKAVLRLPHLAFKLWMTYFMSESDDQEAYLSNEVIEERSGLSENTIIKWRKWLVKHGWLRPCGGTAAERYSKATRGAHLVLIYRVDDPTKNTATSNFEEANTTPTANSEAAESATANVIPPKFAEKVYGSVSVSSSGCGSGCTTAMPTLSAVGGSDSKAIEAFKDKNQKQEQQQNQKPRRLRLVQKYDAPFPEGFNDDPSEVGVRFRFEWCEAHRLDNAKELAPAPVKHEPLEDEFGDLSVPMLRKNMAKIELAISIRQPYVEQILLGVKPYEYRSKLTHVRGRVYLYAAKKPVDDAAQWRKARSEPGKLPTGVIVGSVVISDCEPWKDDGFRYKLEAPKRLRKYLVPNSHPQPKFFRPNI